MTERDSKEAERHLLYWIFRAETRHIMRRDFAKAGAPDWVWPAYRERLQHLGDGTDNFVGDKVGP